MKTEFKIFERVLTKYIFTRLSLESISPESRGFVFISAYIQHMPSRLSGTLSIPMLPKTIHLL